jgi:hypothetical protein
MPSCNVFPIFRFDWRPDLRVIPAGMVLAVLALLAISVCGLAPGLCTVLILLVLAYAAFGLRRYASQQPVQFEIMAQGSCRILEDGKWQSLGGLSWRDWGYLIELSGHVNGKSHTWFWVSYPAEAATRRAMRLLIRSQAQKATPGLPSIITNPVL